MMLATQHKSNRNRLLDGIPVQGIDHHGRPLRDHLIGTHDLLDQWGNAEHVCLAGLFHSVYGTKTFPTAALTTASRDEVRNLIGQRAESLAFVFGMSDRKALLLQNRATPYVWINHRTDEHATISERFLNELIEIEAANFVEQLQYRIDKGIGVVRDMQHRLGSRASQMSPGATEALRQAIASWIGRAPVTAQQGA